MTTPDVAVQDSMIILEMLLIAQSHHAQSTAHGPFSRSKDGAEKEDVSTFPNATREQRAECKDDGC